MVLNYCFLLLYGLTCVVTDLISCLQSSHLPYWNILETVHIFAAPKLVHSIFETVQCLCSDNIIWQTVPVHYNPLRKASEPKTGITSWFDRFITMTSSSWFSKGIQKEINLGYTRLNCCHYYWSVFIVKIKLSYNNKRLVTPVVTQVKNGGNVQ